MHVGTLHFYTAAWNSTRPAQDFHALLFSWDLNSVLPVVFLRSLCPHDVTMVSESQKRRRSCQKAEALQFARRASVHVLNVRFVLQPMKMRRRHYHQSVTQSQEMSGLFTTRETSLFGN